MNDTVAPTARSTGPEPPARWSQGCSAPSLEALQRLLAQVLLVDDAVVAHDEGLDAGHPVLRRCGDEGEAADHRTLHHEVHGAQRRRRTLSLQHLEEVAVVRVGSRPCSPRAMTRAIASPTGPAQVPSAACQARPSCLPGVLMTRCAYWFISAPSCRVQGVFPLGLDVPAAHLDRIELVLRRCDGAGSPAFPACGVEAPFPALLDDRNRQRPVARDQREDGGSARSRTRAAAASRASAAKDWRGCGPHRIFGRHEGLALRSEDRLQCGTSNCSAAATSAAAASSGVPNSVRRCTCLFRRRSR